VLRLGERVLELFDLALQTAGLEPLVPQHMLSRLRPPSSPDSPQPPPQPCPLDHILPPTAVDKDVNGREQQCESCKQSPILDSKENRQYECAGKSHDSDDGKSSSSSSSNIGFAVWGDDIF